MNKDEHISEEQLNAFVDGELDSEEKSRLLNESEQSVELDQRLCKQRKLKELVKHAYIDVPPPKRLPSSHLAQSSFLGRSLVAGVILFLGLSGGFIAHNYFDQTQVSTTSVVSEPVAEIENYLLHVVSAGENEFRQVEIIANEQGLNLLRSDITPYAEQITALQRNNVVFYACSKTIERLEEKGVKVELVPYANPDYTALDRVVTRMQAGWKYEKI